jgi:Flp pilus assembly pilin Flp
MMGSGIIRAVTRLWRNEAGQDLAEYGIAIGVVAAVIAGIAVLIGAASMDLWQTGQTNISTAAN